jgi:hypothetical protein
LSFEFSIIDAELPRFQNLIEDSLVRRTLPRFQVATGW